MATEARKPRVPTLRPFLARHWGSILTVVFGLLSVYFFLQTLQKKGVAYIVPKSSVKVFDSHISSSAYRILDQDNNPIGSDIFSTEVTLWNTGNQPIEPGEVR